MQQIDRTTIAALFNDSPEPIRSDYLARYDAARCAAAMAGAHSVPAVRIALEVVAAHARTAGEAALAAVDMYARWSGDAAEANDPTMFGAHEAKVHEYAVKYRALYALAKRLTEYAEPLRTQVRAARVSEIERDLSALRAMRAHQAKAA